MIETPARIEPATLDAAPAALADTIADLSAEAATLGRSLHPRTAAGLADMVRIMNSYYSNLIEGHNTRPRDIERALAGDLDAEQNRRNLQLESAAHVRLQREVDAMAAAGSLPEPASVAFIKWLHAEFYRDAPDDLLRIGDSDRHFAPGVWRMGAEQDVAVGRHVPPSSDRVDDFMRYFENRYRLAPLGKGARLIAFAAAHHRFNYIHPFPDGNGRVSRLMSHAMAHVSDVGAHGLWSVSRGLARGLSSRSDYKTMMDRADTPRQGDLDGRGNLSERALVEFVQWFLDVCLDQVTFMSGLFDLASLGDRIERYVRRGDRFKPETGVLLRQVLARGEIDRGEVHAIVGLPERTARRILNDVLDARLLRSATPKGPVSLGFPFDLQEDFFPQLFPLS